MLFCWGETKKEAEKKEHGSPGMIGWLNRGCRCTGVHPYLFIYHQEDGV